MRRLLPLLAGATGGLAVWKLLTRRRSVAALPAPPVATEPDRPDPRAEELRAKLERREEREEPAAAAERDPDARRARVHEEARAAAERMRRAPGS